MSELDDRLSAFGEVLAAMREDDQAILRALSALAGEIRDSAKLAKTIGYASSLRVKPGSGVVYGVSGFNNNAATRYIQLFDVHDDYPPQDGAAEMVDCIPVATATGFARDYGKRGRRFENGLWIVTSSTINTKTLGAVDMLAFASYL